MAQIVAEKIDVLDLSIDQEVFSTPGGGDMGSTQAAVEPQGTWTTTTTCWSCKWTCDCPPNSTCTC